MNLLETITSNKAIQAISLIAGLLAAGLAFKEYLYSNPELRATVNSETSLIQESSKIEEIKISVKDNQVNPESEEIVLRTITIENSGNDSILENYYDSTSPWGIEIKNSKIIKVAQSDTNKDYFKNKKSRIQADKIELPRYIIEPGELITLSIISIEQRTQRPEIKIFGKIAKTKIFDTASQGKEISSIAIAFQGGPSIQIIRTTAYFFIFIAAVLIPITAISMLKESMIKRKNKSLSTFLADTYKDKNAPRIIASLKEGKIRKIARLKENIHLISSENIPLTTSILKHIKLNKPLPPALKRTTTEVSELVEHDVIHLENDKLTINSDALEIITETYDSVKDQID
ncbi:hypothetical protein [Pseudomonas paralcaligenes]|uniref:hypothetical protein n=1 Tax=Pseudomonas paralcaligenes TaxID=2772558 RepID=UPI001C80740F|nr:hypothetical protein [Pseudomonas paralcaligenes]